MTETIKKGLILEGGAMRGLFTVGILDHLMERGIEFDGIVGVSAGAAFGCNYQSRQKGRALRYNKRFCRDPRYCSWRSWWKTGDLFGAEFCYHELPDRLDPFDVKSFEENPCRFYLVCTDVHTGKPCYHLCEKADGECFEWMRASGSMPLVSNVVKVGNGEYLDGALADSIPVRFFEGKGFNRNAVILTQPRGYVKKPSKALFLMRIFLRKYPALVAALEKRHILYNETLRYIEEEEKKGKLFVFRPELPLPVDRICHDPEKLQATYDLGYAQAQKQAAELEKFLTAPKLCLKSTGQSEYAP